MKRIYRILLALLILPLVTISAQSEEQGMYTLLIDAYDWGPGVNKVIVPSPTTENPTAFSDYQVTVVRSKGKRGDEGRRG
ncbi:hypothetical protein NYZ99_10180 [Maribacter litopenaei]|uniref:Uncharacterized protein n=1 Tax=Maribacter litopenaei TaxID=2976127 RepID=A0ABY5YBR3_9FLAO|nr:hypothetical protein [Maribacter litopenaei]UWX56515.1 hypothetical protein NYZ99_10180 [Maribacter litopenaei]